MLVSTLGTRRWSVIHARRSIPAHRQMLKSAGTRAHNTRSPTRDHLLLDPDEGVDGITCDRISGLAQQVSGRAGHAKCVDHGHDHTKQRRDQRWNAVFFLSKSRRQPSAPTKEEARSDSFDRPSGREKYAHLSHPGRRRLVRRVTALSRTPAMYLPSAALDGAIEIVDAA